MSVRLDSHVCDFTYDNLINQTYPPADVFGILLKLGQGKLKRGTVIGLSTDGEYVLLGTTAAEGKSIKANCILADNIDTGGETGETIIAEAYRTGHFNRNCLTVKEGYVFTKTDEENLRNGGIFLDAAI